MASFGSGISTWPRYLGARKATPIASQRCWSSWMVNVYSPTSKDGALALWNPESGAMFHALDDRTVPASCYRGASGWRSGGDRFKQKAERSRYGTWQEAKSGGRSGITPSRSWPLLRRSGTAATRHPPILTAVSRCGIWSRRNSLAETPRLRPSDVAQLIVLPDGQRVLASAGDDNMDSILAY